MGKTLLADSVWPTGKAGSSSSVPQFRESPAIRPRCRMCIAGVEMTVLSDTGSTHTLIDEDQYSRIPHLTPLYQAPRVQSLTHEDLPLKGACVLKIANQHHEVLVCKNLGIDLLLGMNVLRRSIINFHSNVLMLGDQTFPLDTAPENFHCYTTSCLPKMDNEDFNVLVKAYRDVFSARDTPVNVAHGVPEASIDT